MKGLRNSNWLLQNSHGDTKYSIRNIVDNSLIATNHARLVWGSGDPGVMCTGPCKGFWREIV